MEKNSCTPVPVGFRKGVPIYRTEDLQFLTDLYPHLFRSIPALNSESAARDSGSNNGSAGDVIPIHNAP